MVQRIQSGLTRLGYNPGPSDGVLGGKTRGAIRAYQEDNRLLADGVPTPELAAHVEEQMGTY
jgi:peptidoglycan hydrolase-like protein with peptidoglycan-binding domain